MGGSTSMRRRWRAVVAVTLFAMLAAGAPASAGIVSVSIGGDGDISIAGTHKYEGATKSVGQTGTNGFNVKFTYKVLGVPLPTKGYYVNSFPTTYRQPSLSNWSGNLDSKTFAKIYNSRVGATQWEVRGSKGFTGTLTVYNNASAKVNSGGSKWFYVGDSDCGSCSVHWDNYGRAKTN